MESGSYLVFVATMGMIYIGLLVVLAHFFKYLFRRDFDLLRRLCLICGVWFGTHLVWIYVMPNGSHSSDQFSGFVAFMHYVYFIVMVWVLYSVKQLSRLANLRASEVDIKK